jgi:biotin---protein ligase
LCSTADTTRFAPENLDRNTYGPDYIKLIESIEGADKSRRDFLRACLVKLGLQVNSSAQPVPSLSPLHLSAFDPDELPSLLSRWKDLLKQSPDGDVVIHGESDTFLFKDMPSKFIPAKSDEPDLSSLSISSKKEAEKSPSSPSSTVDYEAIPKQIYVHSGLAPSVKDTPTFNHHLFYSNLPSSSSRRPVFGRFLLFSEVITSTSTILEKNHSLLKSLPTGFVATADVQVAGRGRGSNVWVSPKGSLMFSAVLWHPATIAFSSPVVFVQYLAAMAVVRAVKRYGKAYADLGVKLKWPNDIYADEGDGKYVKVAGILVNSTYSGEAYGLIIGIGINVANALPTIGLDLLAARKGLQPFQREKLLGLILSSFEDLYAQFCVEGWGRPLEDEYLGMWLHK